MKYKISLLFFLCITLTGCSTLNFFNNENFHNNTEQKKNKFYENLSANGVIKFYIKDNNISSRFNLIKSRDLTTIEFLDIFNDVIVSFQIKPESIDLINYKKNIDGESLYEIINRPIFKDIILNLPLILSGNINNSLVAERYSNGLYKILKTDQYLVYYKKYNKENLPVIMKIKFLNIIFDLKIMNWKQIK